MADRTALPLTHGLPPVTDERIRNGRREYFREGLGWFAMPKEGETDEQLGAELD